MPHHLVPSGFSLLHAQEVPFPVAGAHNVVVGFALLLVGALLVLTGTLAARERLPRNMLWGIRLPSTVRSDRAWRAGHRAAAREMTIIGVGSMAIGSLALSVPFIGTIGLVLTLAGLLHDASVADRAARAAAE